MKDLKYNAEDMLNFANFIRSNFFADGNPNYNPYDREKYRSGDAEYVFICWLEENNKEL